MNSRLLLTLPHVPRIAFALVVAALALLFGGPSLLAADGKARFVHVPEKVEEAGAEVSFENKGQYSVTSGSRTKSGSHGGSLSEQHGSIESIASIHLDDDILLRVGAAGERYSFGLTGELALPEELQSANLVIGADIDIAEQWMMRLEIHPGVYSDRWQASFRDLNCPLIIGFSWLPDKDLQWFFGLYANARADCPIMPGLGLRWKFADRWTLMALPPNPRVEFDLTENLALFCGADLHYGAYHVNDVHGLIHSKNLDNSFVDYTEMRGGVGLKWKVGRSVELLLQGGSMVYREFDFHKRDTTFRSKPSLYGEFGIVANF